MLASMYALSYLIPSIPGKLMRATAVEDWLVHKVAAAKEDKELFWRPSTTGGSGRRRSTRRSSEVTGGLRRRTNRAPSSDA